MPHPGFEARGDRPGPTRELDAGIRDCRPEVASEQQSTCNLHDKQTITLAVFVSRWAHSFVASLSIEIVQKSRGFGGGNRLCSGRPAIGHCRDCPMCNGRPTHCEVVSIYVSRHCDRMVLGLQNVAK